MLESSSMMRGQSGAGRKSAVSLSIARAVLLAAVVVLLLPVGRAHAVTIAVPAQTVQLADIRMTPGATDPAGLGMLFVDGRLAASIHATPSVPATFCAVQLAPGTHQLRAVIRSRGGYTSSPAVTTTTWGVPLPPKLLTTIHAGFYPKAVTLPVSVPVGVTKLTVLVRGKAAWSKAVQAPVTLAVPLTLPSGVDTITLRSENPCASAVTTTTIVRPTWPVPGYPDISSGFGPRWGRMHKGVDIPAPEGTSVVAAGPGKVIWAQPLTTYGGLIMIDHGGSMTTYYAHLSRIDVKMGQMVTMGQHIGRVGVANIAHLHFQLFLNADNANPDMYRRVNSGTPTDPMPYVAP
jgi:murein DD-endopeptidase MepM/ murein hydrolase activator NlpD